VKLYKLTTADGRTRVGKSNETQWGENVTHGVSPTAGPPKLCSATVIHAYASALLAELLDPCHGSFGYSGKLWEAEGEVVISAPDKVGCQTLTTLREIERPVVTTEQRVKFAILVARQVFGGKSPKWDKWAEDWLSGKDRSTYAATYAAAYVAYAANAAYATYAATYAAYAAAYAATYATYAAAYAAYATYATANAATYAANAAANAATYAALDLVALAEEAMR
jgi:hypothetical protein